MNTEIKVIFTGMVQGQDGWGVTYTSTEICAVKGSTVEINCSFTYPSRWKGGVNTVEKTFWFTKWKYPEFVDLKTDSEYAGRVEDLCENNICTLRIRNLTESDSDQYRFRFITNQDAYWGNPGTTLSVTDAPKPPSVSVSPSAEIEEGSSVTLTCSSDANPAANYTWYKKNEDSPKASGQIFNITDFRAEHSGSYSCGAQNKLGRSISTLHQIVVAEKDRCVNCLFSVAHCFSGSWKLPAAATIAVVLLAVISLSVFLWIRRKRASRDSSEPEERADNREECVPDQPEQQDDLQYASVHFSNNRADPLYSNMRAAQPLRHTEQQEVSEYAAVKFSSAAPRTRGQDPEEDPAALYSTVNKSR
ncbi:hypothetical protein NQZ68_013373 [Dissostichus eleginoides]|nr:hypothetical protein NQZ68_013373 [Dissostichus eleginoides]